MSVVLDTHTVLWYLENSRELSAVARTMIEGAVRDARHVRVSAISLVETVYLVERRRLTLAALARLRSCHWSPVTAGSKPPESRQSGRNSRQGCGVSLCGPLA